MQLDPHGSRTIVDVGGTQLAVSYEIRVALERELGLALASRQRWMLTAFAVIGAAVTLAVVLGIEVFIR